MLRQFREIERGELFVVGCDTSMGLSDASTAQFLSVNKLDVPLVYQSQQIAAEMTNVLFPILEKLYKETGQAPVVAYERNNGGVFEMDRLASFNKNNYYKIFQMPRYGQVDPSDPIKLGWDTNTATRPKMLSELKEAIDKKLIKIYDRATIDEMFSFVITTTTTTEKAQAENGSHDDLVMSLAIAWQLYQMTPRPNPAQQDQARRILMQNMNEEIF